MIPYITAPATASVSEKELWERERDEYLKTLNSKPRLTDTELERKRTLEQMSYEAFLRYFTDEDSPEKSIASGIAGVGHVAIVRKTNGRATIVEAAWKIGVREISYEDWKLERKGQMFWHGRLKDIAHGLRAQIAELAVQRVGKPYDFFNFNLENTSGFYCSKLAWLVIRDATRIVVDDEPNPHRLFWFSPKQLTKSSHIEMLQEPGGYGRKHLP
jgi:hypothetical protein